MASKNSKRITEYNINHITNVAMQLFFEKGIEKTTVEEIANEGNISRVTIYKYFPSKLDIALSVLQHYLKETSECMKYQFSSKQLMRMTGYEQLYTQFVTFSELHKENVKTIPFICELEIIINSSESARNIINKTDVDYSLYDKYYLSAIQKGLKDGSIRKDLDESEIKYYLSKKMMQGLCMRLYLFHGRNYFIEYKDDVYEILHTAADKIVAAFFKPPK